MENIPFLTKICLKDEMDSYGWSIGDHTYGAPLVFDEAHGPLSIGRFCSIAPNVSLILSNHRSDGVTTYPFQLYRGYWPAAAEAPSSHEDRGGIEIGGDVWLGAHCTIVAGVKVASGAIVAACSVVTKDVPPYAIVAGNPARIVRYRCTDEQIRDLLAIAWWNWPDEKVQAEAGHLATLSLDDFIRRHIGDV